MAVISKSLLCCHGCLNLFFIRFVIRAQRCSIECLLLKVAIPHRTYQISPRVEMTKLLLVALNTMVEFIV